MKKWQLGLLLVVCAAVMAVGLEMLQSALMPHVYVNSEAEAGGVPTWLDPATGRLALRESWSALRLAATFLLQLAVLVIIFPLLPAPTGRIHSEEISGIRSLWS